MRTADKYYALIPGFILLLLMFVGCKKHTLNEVLPVVKMVSVQPLGKDSVIVKGTIVSDNGDVLAYEGFCYSTRLMPDITQKQKLLMQDSVNFSAHLYINKDSTYYFRCFAANSFGYAVSGALK